MRLIILIFSLVSSGLLAQEVKIMSYNIGSNNWNTTKDSVIGRILEHTPEVLCLHEAGGPKLTYLETTLTNYRLLQTFGSNPSQTATHIFIQNSIDVLDSGFVKTDTYVGYTGLDRFVNWAKFAYNNVSFLVYASHFVSTYGANADSAVIGQYRHANTLVQLMDLHTAYNLPQIACGDFNADSIKAVMQFLLHQTPITYNANTITNPIVMDDSWYLANPNTQKPATSIIGFGSAAIDWILVSANTNINEAIIDNQGINGNGDYPSDHLPLQITLNLTSVTSIFEKSNNLSLQLSPNPFQDYIHCEITLQNPEGVFIQVHDTEGRLVKSKYLKENSTGKYKFTMDLSNMAAGIFLYCIRTSQEQKTGLIIKSEVLQGGCKPNL